MVSIGTFPAEPIADLRRAVRKLVARNDQSLTVSSLSGEEVGAAAGLVADAFEPESLTTALLGGNDEQVQAAFATVLEGYLGALLADGQPIFTARDGDRMVGVAIVTRPGSFLPVRHLPGLIVSVLPAVPTLASSMHWRESVRVARALVPPANVTDTHYMLEELAVAPDRQGEGIGTALLEAVDELAARDPAATGVYLATGDESNRAFYETRGYETIETRPLGDVVVYHMRSSNL